MFYYLIILAALVLDRVTKYIVDSNMQVGQTVPVIENVFHFTYIQNQGAAFSMWQQQWIILIGFPLVIIAVCLVLIFIKRKIWNRLILTSISFICAGGIGNLIDRISQGYVIDMFDFRVFPVFNIADIFVCVGCGLMVLDVVLSERKNRRDN